MDDWTDQDLVRAAQDGDVRAFEELVKRHESFIVASILRVVRNRSTAEDLAQESFFRAWRSLGSFRGDSQFRTWVYRIGTNLSLNHVSRSREQPIEDIPEVQRNDSTTGSALDSAMEKAWHEAVRSLPAELRRPYVLREFEDKPYEAIALELGVPLNTVRTRIHRARRQISDDLKEWK